VNKTKAFVVLVAVAFFLGTDHGRAVFLRSPSSAQLAAERGVKLESRPVNIPDHPATFFLQIKKDDKVSQCTGWAASEKVIITSAHCLTGRIHYIRVVSHASEYDINSQMARDWETSKSYKPTNSSTEMSKYDFAAVFLSSPVKVEPYLLAPYPGADNVPVLYSEGYPGDKQDFPKHIEMWSFTHVPMKQHSLEDVFGECSGNSIGGQSGSAMFIVDEHGRRIAYGVLKGSWDGNVFMEESIVFHAFDEKSLAEINSWLAR
jgi:hypothetical protein